MLTKSSYLAAIDCLTKGWHYRCGIPVLPELSYSEKAIAQEGIRIGEMARTLFPDGILIDEGSNTLNHEKTLQLISAAGTLTLFEATFIYQDAIARADILQRIEGEWFLFEVKSSVAAEKVKTDEINDAAYTTMLLDLCGIQAQKINLLRVSKDYRLGMDNRDFFTSTDCTASVQTQLFTFKRKLSLIMEKTDKPDKPAPTLIMPCKHCDFFATHCVGHGILNPLFDLPRISDKKFNAFIADGIDCVDMIPTNHDLTPSQAIVWQAVTRKQPWSDLNKIAEHLSKIVYPAYYLDFETVNVAIPLYPDVAPYEQIVTQYSIHEYASLFSETAHREFLADYNKDDRRRLAEKLLEDMGTSGSVLVYHATAEKNYIKSLANIFPDLADSLLAIIERIIDLKVIVQHGYYHPDFHGSYSIKDVLPVLVPDMNYDDLSVGDGLTASAVFADIARGKYPENDSRALCANLLEYCKQDTFAMVRIHQVLKGMV